MITSVTIPVTVTKRHVGLGLDACQRGESPAQNCPVARAVRECLRGVGVEVDVRSASIELSRDGDAVAIGSPCRELEYFVVDFDRCRSPGAAGEGSAALPKPTAGSVTFLPPLFREPRDGAGPEEDRDWQEVAAALAALPGAVVTRKEVH